MHWIWLGMLSEVAWATSYSRPREPGERDVPVDEVQAIPPFQPYRLVTFGLERHTLLAVCPDGGIWLRAGQQLVRWEGDNTVEVEFPKERWIDAAHATCGTDGLLLVDATAAATVDANGWKGLGAVLPRSGRNLQDKVLTASWDAVGHRWAVLRGRGVYVHTRGVWSRVDHAELWQEGPAVLRSGGPRGLLAATSVGVWTLDGGGAERLFEARIPVDVVQATDGAVWAVERDGRVLRWAGGELSVLAEAGAFPGQPTAMVEWLGEMWVTTSGGLVVVGTDGLRPLPPLGRVDLRRRGREGQLRQVPGPPWGVVDNQLLFNGNRDGVGVLAADTTWLSGGWNRTARVAVGGDTVWAAINDHLLRLDTRDPLADAQVHLHYAVGSVLCADSDGRAWAVAVLEDGQQGDPVWLSMAPDGEAATHPLPAAARSADCTVDPAGRVWLIVDNALWLAPPSGDAPQRMAALPAAKWGRQVAGWSKQGRLHLFGGESWCEVEPRSGAAECTVLDSPRDLSSVVWAGGADGRLWALQRGEGIWEHRHGQWTLQLVDEIWEGRGQGLERDADGRLWAWSDHTLWSVKPTDAGIAAEPVHAFGGKADVGLSPRHLASGADGSLWLGGLGLSRLPAPATRAAEPPSRSVLMGLRRLAMRLGVRPVAPQPVYLRWFAFVSYALLFGVFVLGSRWRRGRG